MTPPSTRTAPLPLTAHLRRVLLQHARQELRAAVPGPVTVAEVARRWGFTPSRFSVYYRAACCRPPSGTLSS